jgi:hypothetical protein
MKKFLTMLLLLAAAADLLSAQPIAIKPDASPATSKLWDSNVQVTGQSIYSFDVDYRDNGEMYVGIICPESARDTFKVLRSADGGASWSQFTLYLANEHRKFTDIALICGEDSLLVFVPQDTARSTMRDYGARFGYASGVSWFNFTDTLQTPRGIIIDVDADRSAGGDTMMVAYTADSVGTITGTAIRRSINAGTSWLWRMTATRSSAASVAWLKGRLWAVACKSYYPTQYNYKHTFVYLTSDGGLNFTSLRIDSAARDTLNSDPSITACYATGRALIATSYHDPSTSGDIVVYRAVDAGDTTYQLVLDYIVGENQILPVVNCSRFDSDGWVDLSYVDDYSDCIAYLTSQYGDSGSWGSSQVVSDNVASVLIRPKIAYCNDGVHNGPAVFYCGAGQNGIYMNAGWLTGVTAGHEDETPTNNLTLMAFGNKISFKLPQSGIASLKVFNLLGQEVCCLLNENITAGQHRIIWNGHDAFNRRVSSGVYLVRLVSGGQTATAKMLVVR